MTELYETDTHELRALKDFAIGDEIIVNGNAYRVLMLLQMGEIVNLKYGNFNSRVDTIKEHQNMLFPAAKRGYEGRG